jgi:exopolysaccharide production protein ExoQ
MKPLIAAFICICGIVELFYLDRDRTVRTSKALWLPIIYLSIIGSRPVSDWLSLRANGYGTDLVESAGSPIDVAIFALLLVVAFGVLIHRGRRTFSLLLPNWPILVYFLFCLFSVTWSSQPDIAFKRWIKSIDDVAIVFVVVTDPRPAAAFKRLVSWVGFVLLPLSVLFIRYFPLLGRGYGVDGALANKGVAAGKNMLGVIVLVISLCTLWQVLTLWRSKGMPERKRHLLAHGVLLTFGIWLLSLADSSTSLACFVLGAVFIFATNRPSFRRQPGRLHALVLVLILAAATILLFGGQALVASALGRQSNLSGRTEIWAAVIPAAPDALIGAGYESFWMDPINVAKFASGLVGWYHPERLNEAHNGFIEVYLNLGWVGVCLISCVLINGYLCAIAAFKRNPHVGGLLLAYIVISPVYSITEAGFRSLDPIWTFFLLAMVSSTSISSGVVWESMARRPEAGPLRDASNRNQRPSWVYGSR